MAEQRFSTVILGGESKNVAGIEVPPDVLGALGAGQRPRVSVVVNGYRYTNTVGKMGGKHLISLSAEHRSASGLSIGDHVEVSLTLAAVEQAPDLPAPLSQALKSAGLTKAFANAAPSKRKEWIRQVTEAKGDDTRERRIAKVVSTLRHTAA